MTGLFILKYFEGKGGFNREAFDPVNVTVLGSEGQGFLRLVITLAVSLVPPEGTFCPHNKLVAVEWPW